MPPQNELPEGTDHIINGAMETGGSTGGGTGASSGVGASGGGMGDGSALVATGTGNDTGGTGGTGGGGGGSSSGGGVAEQLRSQAYALRDQGVDRAREFAVGGKTRAGDALEELSRVFADTADTIDERLGREYGEYARKAADAVSDFAENLRNKEVDDIYQDVSNAVRKSPGVAIGVAAVVGFALARVVKAGFSDGSTGGGSASGGQSSGGQSSGGQSTGGGSGTTGA
ncbi:MAG TPA: hypothetical protein VGB70_05905 [Allosphingosinicella sp.]|jgi:ElaB/YqjD/DUF883 family membrane-anchored ribosome-binding protein